MEPRQPPAETYTLDEARQKLARDECAIHGHDYDIVVEQGTNAPASLVCGRCSEAWGVARPEIVDVAHRALIALEDPARERRDDAMRMLREALAAGGWIRPERAHEGLRGGSHDLSRGS